MPMWPLEARELHLSPVIFLDKHQPRVISSESSIATIAKSRAISIMRCIGIISFRSLVQQRSINESEMALFYECTECAQLSA